jgi:transcriptional regulator with XRE-family HTH domain
MDRAMLKHIGARIRLARERAGLTQADVANVLNVDRVTVTRYEEGQRAIHVTHLPPLAKLLNVPVAFFFEDYQPPE